MIFSVTSQVARTSGRVPLELTAAACRNIRRKVHETRAAGISRRIRTLTVYPVMALGADRLSRTRARRIDVGRR